MFTAKIAHVLKLYLPTPVIEAMLSYRIGYIRLKGSWMVKKTRHQIRNKNMRMRTISVSFIL